MISSFENPLSFLLQAPTWPLVCPPSAATVVVAVGQPCPSPLPGETTNFWNPLQYPFFINPLAFGQCLEKNHVHVATV